MLVQVVLNVKTKKFRTPFTYELPSAFSYAGPGWRVLVPFGNRLEEGIILDYSTEENLEVEIKPIVNVLDTYPMFTKEMLQTAQWISSYYCCSLADSLRFFMIDKKGISVKEWVHILDWDKACTVCPNLEPWKEEGETKMDKLAFIAYCPPQQWHDLLEIEAIAVEKEGVKKGQGRLDSWLVIKEESLPEGFSRKRQQVKLYTYLKEHGSRSVKELKSLGFSQDVIRSLIQSGIVEKIEKTVPFFAATSYVEEVTLTKEQAEVVAKMNEKIEQRAYYPALLWGVTGSGKTQVYVECAKKAVAQGRQVLVLVPEIALTGQLVRTFAAYFGEEVVIMHSKLAKGERYMAQLRFRNKESHICIGTRSAVFLPLCDLGLIIMDEEHDPSYRQEETPFYHARKVALERARYFSCPLLLGTATPTVEIYYKALQGEYALFTMPYRIAKRPLPTVEVVDMREELDRGNRSVLSRSLQKAMDEALHKGQQGIILLNRRGFSTFVMCRKCGYTVMCDHCEVPMVYHKSAGRLKCHYCEAEKPIPTTCPSCGSRYIKYFGSGTEKAEAMIQDLFPNARVVRLDQDTTRKKEEGERILQAFKRGEYDILLGTQMVAKGHDIPNVTVVGILSADSSLNLPTYTASERTFALLTQAAGRAGRGDALGRVIIQTYVPDHETIVASQHQDFLSFYKREIEYRKLLGYPPFSQLIRIRALGVDQKEVEEELFHIYERLLPTCKEKNVELTPPFPDAIPRLRGTYRYSLIIKGTAMEKVKNIIKTEPIFYKSGIIVEIDSMS